MRVRLMHRKFQDYIRRMFYFFRPKDSPVFGALAQHDPQHRFTFKLDMEIFIKTFNLGGGPAMSRSTGELNLNIVNTINEYNGRFILFHYLQDYLRILPMMYFQKRQIIAYI